MHPCARLLRPNDANECFVRLPGGNRPDYYKRKYAHMSSCYRRPRKKTVRVNIIKFYKKYVQSVKDVL